MFSFLMKRIWFVVLLCVPICQKTSKCGRWQTMVFLASVVLINLLWSWDQMHRWEPVLMGVIWGGSGRPFGVAISHTWSATLYGELAEMCWPRKRTWLDGKYSRTVAAMSVNWLKKHRATSFGVVKEPVKFGGCLLCFRNLKSSTLGRSWTCYGTWLWWPSGSTATWRSLSWWLGHSGQIEMSVGTEGRRNLVRHCCKGRCST